MSYTRNWDETTPGNHTARPETPLKMREIKIDIAERLKNFFYGFISGETDTAAKQLTFKEQTSDPTNVADTAIIYAKEVSGVTEIFVRDSAGNIKQITSGGKLNIASDEAVLLTGDQTIAGVKTFSSIPVGPSSDPSSDDQLVRKKYVDDQIDAAIEVIAERSYSSSNVDSLSVSFTNTKQGKILITAVASEIYDVDWSILQVKLELDATQVDYREWTISNEDSAGSKGIALSYTGTVTTIGTHTVVFSTNVGKFTYPAVNIFFVGI